MKSRLLRVKSASRTCGAFSRSFRMRLLGSTRSLSESLICRRLTLVSGDATRVLTPEQMGSPLTTVEARVGQQLFSCGGTSRRARAPKGAERFAQGIKNASGTNGFGQVMAVQIRLEI
jgi:hypothetical protein